MKMLMLILMIIVIIILRVIVFIIKIVIFTIMIERRRFIIRIIIEITITTIIL